MNKKLLFVTMSLAALTACTNDDFQSQKVAEEAGNVQFEVLNNDVATRASMDGNTIKWSANDGDLFTLYHGATLGATANYQNATYKAVANEGEAATLTTPSMITAGGAIMVWPVDTTFYYDGAQLTVKIPALQTNIENKIPYVSDEIDIKTYAAYSETPATPGAMPTAYNTAGKDRKYPVIMRPMASQLIVNVDYAGTDAVLTDLYAGDDPINPISVTSVALETTSTFTTEAAVQFGNPATYVSTTPGSEYNVPTQWATVANNNWKHVTELNAATPVATAAVLTTKCLDPNNNNSAKLLMLPQPTISGGLAGAAVVVNTIYGSVLIGGAGTGSAYTTGEIADAWYRFVSATTTAATGETKAATAGADGKFKTTSEPAMGLQQTINGFSAYKATKGVIKGEPVGAAATRYVKTLLGHLDMNTLHVTTDKQLYDAVRVWQKMDLVDATVFLDGNASGEFTISQKTIKKINEINAAVPGGAKSFKVKPCVVGGEACATIVITGGNDIQDMPFIVANGTTTADIALAAGETWKWNGTNTASTATAATKIVKLGTGVKSIINRGTLLNDATATLANYNANASTQTNVPLVNNGTWNIKNNAVVNVQFNVTNNGTVNIQKGSQYRMDGSGHIFTNDATKIPSRFKGGNDKKIGTVWNYGVFANVNGGNINNYGLIEHADNDAKTYITTNQTSGASFATTFANANPTATPPVTENKMGRINLPWGNKDENNISINNALAEGFVSVTVDGEITNGKLNITEGTLGSRVNYLIVKSGVTNIIGKATTANPIHVDYLEINEEGTEVEWLVETPQSYTGLIVLSPVNINLDTQVTATVTYLGAEMYVAGTFNKAGTNWSGYYGDTSGEVASKYITFK